MHTRKTLGTRHFCLQTRKPTIRSSTRYLQDCLPHTRKLMHAHIKSNSTLQLFSPKERFNRQQTERFWPRKLMFTFQPSLFQAARFSFIVEKTSQRRREIAQPKHCQARAAVSYGSSQRNIMETCQKNCPVRYQVSVHKIKGG